MTYIKGFDGLRCISIVLVVITHLGIAELIPSGSYWRENFFYFFSGAAGVNIFFAISGFLITTLLLQEQKRYGSVDFKRFFARRFLRLLPPIIPFYLALFLFMKMGYVRETYIGLAASLFYLFNFVPKAKFIWSPELSHTWSLAVEEQFYLLWAAVFKFFRGKRIYLIIGFLMSVCVVTSFLLPTLEVSYKGESYLLGSIFFTGRWMFPAIGAILAGALIALFNWNNTFGVQDRFTKTSYGLLALLVFCSPLYLPTILSPMFRIFHGTGAALCLLWVYQNQGSSIVKILEFRPFRYIGRISYGIYIWQGFFIRTGPEALPKIWVHDPPINVLLAFATAIISYELYEKRVMKLKKWHPWFVRGSSKD